MAHPEDILAVEVDTSVPSGESDEVICPPNAVASGYEMDIKCMARRVGEDYVYYRKEGSSLHVLDKVWVYSTFNAWIIKHLHANSGKFFDASLRKYPRIECRIPTEGETWKWCISAMCEDSSGARSQSVKPSCSDITKTKNEFFLKFMAKEIDGGYAYYGRKRSVMHILEKKWMHDTFDASFIELLHTNSGKFLYTRGHLPDDNPYCAAYGAESAFRYVGLESIADFLLDCKDRIKDSVINPVAEISALLMKDRKDALPPLSGWQAHRISSFDPLEDRSSNVTVVQLCADDGDNSHVIAIANHWIFDSKHDRIPLTAENLDACIPGDRTFARCSYAIRFVPGKRLKRILDVSGSEPQEEGEAKKIRVA